MANLGAKLKGMNWKAFFIDHCEKLVLGTVGVFVLSSLGMTQWSTYKTDPEVFTQKTNTGNATFKNARWPQERKTEFDARDLGDVVARVTDGIPSSQGDIYAWSAKWNPGVYKEKELVDEPKYERLIEPVADAGRILIAMLPETNAATSTTGVIAGSTSPAGTSTTTVAADNEFAPRPGTVVGSPSTAPIGAPQTAPEAGHSAASGADCKHG